MNNFSIKKNILFDNKFVDKYGITTKGELIKVLNGYEQIPIINVIDSKIFAKLNPIQIAGLVGGMANIEYRIHLLTMRDPVGNHRIINKLKRKVRVMENN